MSETLSPPASVVFNDVGVHGPYWYRRGSDLLRELQAADTVVVVTSYRDGRAAVAGLDGRVVVVIANPALVDAWRDNIAALCRPGVVIRGGGR